MDTTLKNTFLFLFLRKRGFQAQKVAASPFTPFTIKIWDTSSEHALRTCSIVLQRCGHSGATGCLKLFPPICMFGGLRCVHALLSDWLRLPIAIGFQVPTPKNKATHNYEGGT